MAASLDRPESDTSSPEKESADTGVPGLDLVLGGGFPRGRAYLVQGPHGSGKTTLALQFCLAGVRRGERVLHISTCESEEEIRAVARSHGWSLEGMAIRYLDPRPTLGGDLPQTVFHPSEVEFPRTMDGLREIIEDHRPHRLVVDSLSEIRLLAPDARWFRQQVLALKDDLARGQHTTLFCDSAPHSGQPVETIFHGVVHLLHEAPEYGPDRRWLRVSKLRARAYATGLHDFRIHTGGIEVYPRVFTPAARQGHEEGPVLSGIPRLDALFGGGPGKGTALLLHGPSGTGKSSLASRYAVTSARAGERGALFAFDERLHTLLERTRGLGLDLEGEMARGAIEARQIDPAELTPGEFSQLVREGVEERGVRMVVIDSLAGYMHAMQGERALALHLRELLGYLAQRGITVLMILAQHGLPGSVRHSSFDVSYIVDSVLQFHVFEHAGELRKAVSVYKRRDGPHEASLRELRFDARGIHIGEPLRGFQGITTGSPVFLGEGLPHVNGTETD